jgi:hypothetical protein
MNFCIQGFFNMGNLREFFDFDNWKLLSGLDLDTKPWLGELVRANGLGFSGKLTVGESDPGSFTHWVL